jgi:hypothetical protein
VVAIVYAAQVDGYARMGQAGLAQETSDKADVWGNYAIGLGVAAAVASLLMQVFFRPHGIPR